MFYYLSNNINNFYVTTSTYPKFDKKSFDNFPIPLPPIEKQKKIVEILDQFYTLTHSISEGLPKEIELREKQYQYYRNLLLDFPKPDNEKKDDHQNN